MRRILHIILASVAATASAQEQQTPRITDGIEYRAEAQATASGGKTPLWLNANKYGLSSLEERNAYLRIAAERPLSVDQDRKWGVGYGIDIAGAYHHSSRFIVQQAYVEGRWLKGTLSAGSKEYPMELKNNELSSGSQALGKNARPIPQVRLALPEYWALPVLNGWVQIKGHIAYGKPTDTGWQHDFTGRKSKYTDGMLFHSKAGYLRIGKDEMFSPLSIELGLEMAAQFGGTSYLPQHDGSTVTYRNGAGLKDFWLAFMPGGAEVNETIYQNAEGNQLGSWLVRLNWDADTWRASLYADKYFEDHSAMFLLDYDGYGHGDEWNVKKDNRYLLYDLKDIMLGAEVNIRNGGWLRDIVFEYIYTKYQSGPVYHDRTPSLSDHVGGRDQYYNHGIFPGWQHWGQVIGNPLYRSPIYNEDGGLDTRDNRFMALHLGISGQPAQGLRYRLLGTYQEGLGTYDKPYTDKRHNVSFLAEAEYSFGSDALKGWSLKGGYAMDFGSILGHNRGFQLTISKHGIVR